MSTLTKYGQIACDICKTEPPLGASGLCYKCTQGRRPVAFVEPDDEPETPTEPVSTTAVEEVKVLREVATKPRKPLKLEGPAHSTSEQAEPPVFDAPMLFKDDLKGADRATLEAILAAPATTEEEKARKNKARSRLWHLKHKETK